jgi:hypothetical protein
LDMFLQIIPDHGGSVSLVTLVPAPWIGSPVPPERYPLGIIYQITDTNLKRGIPDLITAGEKAEPGNAYWKVARAALHLLTGQRNAARADFRAASNCRYYDSHLWEQMRSNLGATGEYGNLTLEEKAYLRALEPGSHFLNSIQYLLPRLPVDLQDAHQPGQAFLVAEDITHALDLVVQSRTTWNEKRLAGSTALRTWQWLGGYYHDNQLATYLRLKGLDATYAGMAHASEKIYLRQARAYGPAGAVQMAAAQVARIQAINLHDPPIHVRRFWPANIDDTDPGSDLQWRLVRWWWPMESFLGLALLSAAGIVLTSIWLPPLDSPLPVGRKQIAVASGTVLLGTTGLSFVTFLLMSIPRNLLLPDEVIRWLPWGIPLTGLALAWVGNGLWRNRKTLLPEAKGEFASASQLKMWRIGALILRFSPVWIPMCLGMAALSLVVWSNWMRYANPGVNGRLYETDWFWGTYEFLSGAAKLTAFLSGVCLFVVFNVWRYARPLPIRSEFIRVAWALRATFTRLLVLSSWIYLAFHIVMIPERLAVAAEINRILANGY